VYKIKYSFKTLESISTNFPDTPKILKFKNLIKNEFENFDGYYFSYFALQTFKINIACQ
jgi:hypothetical protein